MRQPKLRLFIRLCRFACLAATIAASCDLLFAQVAEIPVSASLPSRKLADGVLKVIAPEVLPAETRVGPTDLEFVKQHPELEWSAPDFTAGTPYFSSPGQTLLELGRGVILRHSAWCLEFAFKPVRMVEVDVPIRVPVESNTEGGSTKVVMQRKLVWYMVYRVRYIGNDIDTQLETYDGTVNVPIAVEATRREAVRFIPRFVLSGNVSDSVQQGKFLTVDLNDEIIPVAKGTIAARERIGKPLLDGIEMAFQSIPFSSPESNHEFWGVATWADVDPRIDFFSVQVRGLSNAYRVTEANGNKKFLRKTLQLHFWRPGDTVNQTEDQIRFGLPSLENPTRMKHVLEQFQLKERLDYLWVYR